MKQKTRNRLDSFLDHLDRLVEYLEREEPYSESLIAVLEKSRDYIMVEGRITWNESKEGHGPE